MTSLTLDDNQAAYQIHAYKPGHIKINDKILTDSLIVAAHQLIENWAPQHVTELTKEHLRQATSLKPDILIIGTGATQQFIPLEMYGEFLNQGIGIEIMDTAAASRTYNILTAESRNVAAALILR